jgi:chemotaxis protein methyltransferase CheR
MVEKARAGRYGALEVNRGLPAPYLVKYFERAGAGWRVKDDLRSMVEFRQLNLVGPWPTLPRMDVVFLRNVLIYFDADTKRQVLERVAAQLHPEGFLFLGAAETAMHAEGRFERLALERAK